MSIFICGDSDEKSYGLVFLCVTGDSAINERFSSRIKGVYCSVDDAAKYSCVTIRLMWLDAADSLCLRLASCFYELANPFSCRCSPLVSLYFT